MKDLSDIEQEILEILSEVGRGGCKARYLNYRLKGMSDEGRRPRVPSGQELTQELLVLQRKNLIEKIGNSKSVAQDWRLTELGRTEAG